jgi:hypothetical protein
MTPCDDDPWAKTVDEYPCRAATSHAPDGVLRRCQLRRDHATAHAIEWRRADERRIARTWHDDAQGVDLEADARSHDFAVRWTWELAHSLAWIDR